MLYTNSYSRDVFQYYVELPWNTIQGRTDINGERVSILRRLVVFMTLTISLFHLLSEGHNWWSFKDWAGLSFIYRIQRYRKSVNHRHISRINRKPMTRSFEITQGFFALKEKYERSSKSSCSLQHGRAKRMY